MIKDNRGQVSFEYLLIFAISFLVLIVFTMPLLNQTVETTFDVSDSLKVKSDLSSISSAIKTVYGEGQGSKQNVHIYSKKPIRVSFDASHLSSKLKLKNKSNKLISVPCKSNLKSSSISLKQGENIVVVEWPVGSENMLLYCR